MVQSLNTKKDEQTTNGHQTTTQFNKYQ